MSAEPLTIAYVAIGAHSALRAATTPNDFTEMVDAGQGGELNFIDECITHAGVCDDLFPLFEETFAGVHAYDIAEAFGAEVARRSLQGESVDRADAEAIARCLYEELSQ